MIIDRSQAPLKVRQNCRAMRSPADVPFGVMPGSGWTRRGVLASLGILAARDLGARKPARFASEQVRFADPATDVPVVRLTSPSYSAHLPGYHNRCISRRNGFLLFWSDRSGSPQAYRMNLRSGESEQLTEARDLDGSSLALLPDDQGFCYFDGLALHHTLFRGLRERAIYETATRQRRLPGLSITADGAYALTIESVDGAYSLRMIALRRGESTVAGSAAPLSDPVANPRDGSILFRTGPNGLAVLARGKQAALPIAAGRCGPYYWSPSGTSVLYLNFPGPGKLNAIREIEVATGADRLVSTTTQFGHFEPNGDASVFVGASASMASPFVLLLLRTPQREFVLCEHGARDPARVAPRFSPDSQRVVFESDRQGRSALYFVNVERLVEETPG